jgi:hypothetical protein
MIAIFEQSWQKDKVLSHGLREENSEFCRILQSFVKIYALLTNF